MTEFDRAVGAETKQLRKSLGMSQAQLAYELTERGFPIQQQTILKVERGSRSLKIGEALALADILEVEIAKLAGPAVVIQQRAAEIARRQRLAAEIVKRQKELDTLQAELGETA